MFKLGGLVAAWATLTPSQDPDGEVVVSDA